MQSVVFYSIALVPDEFEPAILVALVRLRCR